jgi:hypothetical protein
MHGKRHRLLTERKEPVEAVCTKAFLPTMTKVIRNMSLLW